MIRTVSAAPVVPVLTDLPKPTGRPAQGHWIFGGPIGPKFIYRYAQPDDLDRRRRLVASSRYDDTPRHLLIELNGDGSDYAVLQSGLEAALPENWPAVLHALTEAQSKLTRQEILDNFSADYHKPDSTTLWRWLSRGVAQGLVCQQGTGRLNDPFRYWLPERKAMMRPDGGSREEMQAWNKCVLAELFGPTCISSRLHRACSRPQRWTRMPKRLLRTLLRKKCRCRFQHQLQPPLR